MSLLQRCKYITSFPFPCPSHTSFYGSMIPGLSYQDCPTLLPPVTTATKTQPTPTVNIFFITPLTSSVLNTVCNYNRRVRLKIKELRNELQKKYLRSCVMGNHNFSERNENFSENLQLLLSA